MDFQKQAQEAGSARHPLSWTPAVWLLVDPFLQLVHKLQGSFPLLLGQWAHVGVLFSERADAAHSPMLKPEDAFIGSDGCRVWSGAYGRPLKAKKEKNHTDLSMRVWARSGFL